MLLAVIHSAQKMGLLHQLTSGSLGVGDDGRGGVGLFSVSRLILTLHRVQTYPHILAIKVTMYVDSSSKALVCHFL